MSSLKLFLLGTPHVELNQRPLEIKRRKVLALLAYLAVHGTQQRRDTLATLLWPDSSQQQARKSLRRHLSELNQTLGGDWLDTNRENVGLRQTDQLWLDVHQFQQYLATSQTHDHAPDDVCSDCLPLLREAAALYQADFLTGFNLPNCPEFDEWQFFETEGLRQSLSTTLQRLIQIHQQQDDLTVEAAIAYARRWLSLDPMHEPAHRALMQLYFQADHQAAALRQYEECVRILDAELGLEPEEETVTLYEAIKAKRLVTPLLHSETQENSNEPPTLPKLSDSSVAESPPPQPPKQGDETPSATSERAAVLNPSPKLFNLPTQSTSFIGRQDELAEIKRLILTETDCRLLTVIGAGGMGKTRLSIQAATQLAPHFMDGVCFVPLVGVSGAEFLLSAIRDALNLSRSGSADPKAHLLNYLREKQMMLLLDNFEHLLNESNLDTGQQTPEALVAIDLLLTMLADAPQVKLLVTSRERLNLQEEWLFTLDGLPFPTKTNSQTAQPPEDSKLGGAITLFASRARRVHNQFDLATDWPHVVRLCQIVEGMPLGIELAAAWLSSLSCAEIVQELDDNLDLLATTQHNVPTRHQNIRAVFDYSWQHLDKAERQIFSQLAVFRGGFTRQAASAVSQATLPLLSVLVGKSLLRYSHNGRYTIHELLRQFALEKLSETPELLKQTQQNHSVYYLTYLADIRDDLYGSRQLEAYAQLEVDVDNIRMAWQRAAQNQDLERLEKSLEILYYFLDWRGAFQEMILMIQQAISGLSIASDQSISIFEQIDGEIESSDRIWTTQERSLTGALLCTQALAQNTQGVSRDQALQLAKYGLTLIQRAKPRNRYLEAWALIISKNVFTDTGDATKSRQVAQESVTLFKEVGDQWGSAFASAWLGSDFLTQGDLLEAQTTYRDSLRIYNVLGDYRGKHQVLLGVGIIDAMQGNAAQAQQSLTESVNIGRKIGYLSLTAYGLKWLGKEARQRGAYEQAKQYFEEALAMARESGVKSFVVHCLDELGALYRVLRNFSQAQQILDESHKQCHIIDSRWEIAECLSELGQLAYDLENYDEATELLTKASSIYQKSGHKLWRVPVLISLGDTIVVLGQAKAQHYYDEALYLSISNQLVSQVLQVAMGVATMLMHNLLDHPNGTEQAVELLALVQSHPASWQEHKDRAVKLLQQLKTNLSVQAFEAAQARGQALEVWATAEALLELLSPPKEAQAQTRSNTLPLQPTPFIGRDKELAAIQQLLLEEPNCRLLTLVGPGGIGKTRLALAAAEQISEGFSDGVYFVGLASVSEPEFIVSAIVEALSINFYGVNDPKTQLLAHLSQKQLCLIIDNVEHLLAGVELFVEILRAAPQLKLIATSRERLNLQEEWGYEVGGMVFPQLDDSIPTDTSDLDNYSAIQLFLQRARRAEASFVPSQEDIQHIIRICQLVNGMPLGLELAAPWIRTLSCQEIAQEIERNLDFLSTDVRNVPERHRSLKAVFEQTWRQLSTREQVVLSKFSVFQGGCTREAAETVAGATLTLLSSLVDKALLRRNQNGRFDLHELIRQFAAEQLESNLKVYEQSHHQHYVYYASFLQQRINDLKAQSQVEASAEIRADLDNIREAWRCALAIHDVEALDQIATGLWQYSNSDMRVSNEIETTFEQAITILESVLDRDIDFETVEKRENLISFLMTGQGFLHSGRSVGSLKTGRVLIEAGLDRLRQNRLSDLPKEAFILLSLGWIYHVEGNYKKGYALGLESHRQFVQLDDPWGIADSLRLIGNTVFDLGRLEETKQVLQEGVAFCRKRGVSILDAFLSNLARLFIQIGEYAKAEKLLAEGLELNQEIGNPVEIAFTLRKYSRLAIAQGNYEQAWDMMQKSISLFEESNNPVPMSKAQYLGPLLRLRGDYKAAERLYQESLAAAKKASHHPFSAEYLSGLGCLVYDQGDYKLAEAYQQEALAIWQQVGNETELASVLRYMGHIAIARNQVGDARSYFSQALNLTLTHQLAPIALDVFVGVAKFFSQANGVSQAFELLTLAEHHAASTYETKQKARQQWDILIAEMPTEAAEQAKAKGQSLDWQETAQQLIEALSVPNLESTPTITHNLPAQPTPFIGRDEELAAIRQLLLEESDCRLLTLVGPGGTGKTRLALAAAEQIGEAFSDGVIFIGLASVSEPAFIISAMVEALGISFYGAADPKTQLLDHLQEKRLCLVLDNFEHLLDGVDLLIEILNVAPKVKLLATSRERLNLQEEWGYEVWGMAFPNEDQTFEVLETSKVLETYSAIQLFLQRARRANASFTPSKEDIQDIIRICQLVDGMPLGLELAAPWMRTLSCQGIAQEIERNLDFLSTDLRNVPERHRSLRAVFEQTWQQLSEAEQAVLSKLSVFRGGCTRAAAETITSATLPVLSALTDKGLLKRNRQDRYEIHELIRQFAAKQLQDRQAEQAETQQRHCTYYTTFLKDRTTGLKSNRQQESYDEIIADNDNIRTAWSYATEHRNAEAIEAAAECLIFYYIQCNLYYEGRSILRQAVIAFSENPTLSQNDDLIAELKISPQYQPLMGFLMAGLGYLRAMSDSRQRGQVLLEQALSLLRNAESRDERKMGLVLVWLGYVLHFRGYSADGMIFVEESLTLCRQYSEKMGEIWGLMLMGSGSRYLGHLAESEHYYLQGLALCDEIGDKHWPIYYGHNIARVYIEFGQYNRAQQYIDLSFKHAEAFNNLLGLAMAWGSLGVLLIRQGNHEQAIQAFHKVTQYQNQIRNQWEMEDEKLGLAHHLQGNHDQAEQLYQQALMIYQAKNHPFKLRRCLSYMGHLAYDQGNLRQAEQYQQEALTLAEEAAHEPNIASVLRYLGYIMVAKGASHNTSEATQYFRDALPLTLKHQLAPLALDIFVGVANLFAETNTVSHALELLSLAQHDPASTHETKQKARRQWAALTVDLPPETVSAAKTNGQILDWQETAQHLIEALANRHQNTIPTTADNSAAQPNALAARDVGQRYVQETLIATGGMGEVYQGRDTETGQRVAIKRLKPELVAENPAMIKRLIREGEALRQLNHPNIVQILALIEDEAQPLIVMEYVPGGSLRDLLAQDPQPSLRRVLDLSLELADALTRAHHLGILHRDIKPANVLLAEDGTPRLTDFGVARLSGQDTRLTQAGSILGTIAYLSPEACLGEELDIRSDIWSFGVLLFEMLSGQPLFDKQHITATLAAILRDAVPDLAELRPDVPLTLIELVKQMLIKDREQRIDSMRQVAARLEMIQRH